MKKSIAFGIKVNIAQWLLMLLVIYLLAFITPKNFWSALSTHVYIASIGFIVLLFITFFFSLKATLKNASLAAEERAEALRYSWYVNIIINVGLFLFGLGKSDPSRMAVEAVFTIIGIGAVYLAIHFVKDGKLKV